MQKSVESAGPQQQSGESSVFIRCMFLEIKLSFLMSFTKCDASTKHDALIDRIRKNSTILRTMQRINARLHHHAAEDLNTVFA